ncbi:hypothetical protein HPB50_018544 [Hyalomma asiaticum]|uniref:Uncharacterized protein n=1 Tax=Hyalomma asiaticum TaxID=266040 RepID=A0ACB7TMZ8_HYAAI|nr:hypothetical protein HPB50_018544 [Hyalomma asiaticum]
MAAPRFAGVALPAHRRRAIHRAPTEAMQITERFAGSVSARPPDFIALVAKMPRRNREARLLLQFRVVCALAFFIHHAHARLWCERSNDRGRLHVTGLWCLVDLGYINGAYDATRALTPFTWPDAKRTAPENEAHIENARKQIGENRRPGRR